MHVLTHAAFWRVTWPVIISQASIPLLSLSDTFVASHSGASGSLPALVLGAKVYEFVGMVFFFLAISTCTLVSKSLAQKDEAQARLWLYRSLLLASVISVLVVPVVIFVADPWLHLLGADAVTFAPAKAYVLRRLVGLPALIVLEGFIGYFLGRLATRSVMFITLTMNLLNVSLNIILVLGFEQGVEGIAWATTVSQWVGLACALLMFLRERKAMKRLGSGSDTHVLTSAHVKWSHLFALGSLRSLMAANLNLLVRSICVLGYLQGITYMSGLQGRAMVGAMGVAMTVMLAASFIQDSLARSTEAFVSRSADNPAQLLAILRLCGLWFLGAGVLFATIFGLGQSFILTAFGFELAYLSAAQSLWPFLVVYVALMPLNYYLNSVLFGLQAFSALRNIYALAFVVFAAGILLLFEPQPAMALMWGCIAIFDVTRCVLMLRALLRARRDRCVKGLVRGGEAAIAPLAQSLS